ncbi:hypothetical protein Tco_0298061, partial [Tanacetum coccineum]
MDNRSGRSLSKNERAFRSTTNRDCTGQWRNFDSIPSGFQRKHKCSINGKIGEKASSCVFRQPNITWGRARIPGMGKAHTGPRICR